MCAILVTLYRKNKEALERVLKRFTWMLLKLDISHKERLEKLGLFSPECWRFGVDLLEVYKMMRGLNGLNSQNLLSQAGNVKYPRP